MALTKQIRKSLEEEMGRLQNQMGVLRGRVQTIRKLLDDDAKGLEGATGVALRPFILQVIKAHPGKLRAADIAGEVELSGYKPRGKTSARTLTYSELARLVKEEKVAKTSDGAYRLMSGIDYLDF